MNSVDATNLRLRSSSLDAAAACCNLAMNFSMSSKQWFSIVTSRSYFSLEVELTSSSRLCAGNTTPVPGPISECTGSVSIIIEKLNIFSVHSSEGKVGGETSTVITMQFKEPKTQNYLSDSSKRTGSQ